MHQGSYSGEASARLFHGKVSVERNFIEDFLAAALAVATNDRSRIEFGVGEDINFPLLKIVEAREDSRDQIIYHYHCIQKLLDDWENEKVPRYKYIAESYSHHIKMIEYILDRLSIPIRGITFDEDLYHIAMYVKYRDYHIIYSKLEYEFKYLAEKLLQDDVRRKEADWLKGEIRDRIRYHSYNVYHTDTIFPTSRYKHIENSKYTIEFLKKEVEKLKAWIQIVKNDIREFRHALEK